MERARRKVQMFTAEQVEVLRSYLAHKATEPPPQPEMLMMGGDCTSCVPRTEEAEGKRLLAEGAGRVSEEKGVVISTNALSTYLTKLAPTREKTKSRAACKGRSVALSTAEGRHGQSQMKPDVLL